MRAIPLLPVLLVPALLAAAGPSPAELRAVMTKLRPLHRKLGRPQPGEWLYEHPEDGQTFREYLACDPTLPRDGRNVLYVQPLGGASPAQQRVVALTSEFLGLYYGLPVRTLPPLPITVVPARAQRRQPRTGYPQIHAGYIRDEVLKPRVPPDAAALLALTAWDLWPGGDWQFVFGEASLADRVGVWSIYRFGDPAKDDAAFKLCLVRAMGTAVHETGHMFSIEHCTRWACCMNGSDSLEEADRQPLELCPECLAKVCWATGQQPAERFRKLADFCARNGLKEDEAFYRASIAALERKITTKGTK